MPNPNTEAFRKAPPKKVSNKPKIPSACPVNFDESTPGRVTKDPSLKMIRNPKVFRILVLNSSMENIFFMVSMNFFIYSSAVIEPPAFSIASFAFSENL